MLSPQNAIASMRQVEKKSLLIHNFIKKPIIMGILNVTPDSFSDGGKYLQSEDAVKHAEELIKNGADIIDVGGESTKPGATYVPEEEELKRVIPIIHEVKKIIHDQVGNDITSKRSILISIDTYKANVAQAALEAGATMINDVSGLTMDPEMIKVVAKANCPVVIMHNKGIPATKPEIRNQKSEARVQKGEDRRPTSDIRYPTSVLEEVYNWLQKQTTHAINNGIKKENIIIDPGIGFGKTGEEDMELIENLSVFQSLGFPILVGPSRKSFIKKLFGKEISEGKNKEIIELCAKKGVDIVRVHLC